MSDKKDNIKELFQKELGNYQAKVNPNLWKGIQAGIGSAGATTGAGSALGLAGKITIGVATVAAVTVGTIFYVNQEDNPENNAKTTINIADTIPNPEENNKEDLIRENLKNETKKQDKTSIKETESSTIGKHQEKEDNINKEENKVSSNQVSEEQESNKNASSATSNSTLNKKGKSNSSALNNTKELQENSTKNLAETPATAEEQSITKTSEIEKVPEENVIIESPEIKAKVVKQNNQYVTFNVEGVPQEGYIVWDFGDGSIDRTLNPEHFYAEAGTYEVKCTIGIEDKEITETLQVDIQLVGEIGELPNVFTPNGDGRNDEFFITCKNLKNFQLTVIDNQQNIIYSTNEVDFRWNGLDKSGKQVKEGTYYYIIVAEDEAGNTLNKYQQLRLKR